MLRALLLACFFLITLHGQAFDLATIRPHAPDDERFQVRMPNGGHFAAVGVTSKLLVIIAYGLQESQLVGGPNWFATEKWDVEAKCDDDTYDAEQTSAMLRNLLMNRFSLRVHRAIEQRVCTHRRQRGTKVQAQR
jgi:uncharacterized protein (TIGR03435 family)